MPYQMLSSREYAPLTKFRKTIVIFVLSQALLACAVSPPAQEVVSGPLVNRIFKHNSTELSEAELTKQLLSSDVIYLGEEHDNPRHHERQKQVIQTLLDHGKTPAIGMEVIFVEQSSITMNYVQMPDNTKVNADEWLRAKLGWLGDSLHWERYGESIQLARKHKLPIFGIDLNKMLRHRIGKTGLAGLSPAESSMLSLQKHDDNTYRDFMYDTFKKAHCGWGSENYLSKLYDNWNARNDKMASTISLMASKHENRPIVVIVGAGHTRFNRGVIESLLRLDPTLKQTNLAFIGVRENLENPLDYSPPLQFQGEEYGYPYEYSWFTEGRPDNDSLCKDYLNSKKKK